jgi:uncharacterized protein (TIGR02145 family)
LYLGVEEKERAGKLKEEGNKHWTKFLGLYTKNVNQTGFTALPGGKRDADGSFDELRKSGYWWSTTEGSTYNAYDAWIRKMSYADNYFDRVNRTKKMALSVRCLKD